MALGGGTFVTQNKILPGTYINFVSAKRAAASLSERGIAAIGMELDWGPSGEVFSVESLDFEADSLSIFGRDYKDDKMRGLRDLFSSIRLLYVYRLNSAGEKATCAYATAKYEGIRGNDLKVAIHKNVDDAVKLDVQTVLGTAVIETQTVGTAAELKDNSFLVWKKDATLTETAATPLTGGSNGAAVTAAEHQTFLDKIESFSFNAIGVVSETAEINQLYAAFCRRMREEQGVKFQAVTFHNSADYEGVINVKNVVKNEGWSKASLAYWVTGVAAGCEVNKSNLNKRYDGGFQVDTDFTQRQLEKAIAAGEFTLHQVGDDVRVLQDINSLVTVTEDRGEVFKDNQSIRVMDQIANDIAVLFSTKYLGMIPNDAAGRISLWSDIVKHHEQLQKIRAIENFEDSDVVVSQGDTKKSVVVQDAVTVVNAMAQVYMTVTVA